MLTAPIDRTRRRAWLVLLLLFVLLSTVIGRVATVYGGAYDAQLFRYIAERWLEGMVPYADVWDFKPPGIFAVIAAVEALFPRNLVAMAIVEGIFVAGFAATVYFLTRAFGAPFGSAALATAGAAIMSNLWYYNEGGLLTEVFVLWPSVLAMLAFWHGLARRRVRWMFLSGVFVGVAVLFKPPGLAAFIAQACFLALCWLLGRIAVRDVGMWLLASVAGIAAAWAPAVLYFAGQGALTDFLYATVVYPLLYAGGADAYSAGVLRAELRILKPTAGLIVSAVVLAIAVLKTLSKPARLSSLDLSDAAARLQFASILTLLWALGDLAGALAGGRAYRHYFLALAPSFAVAAGLVHWLLVEMDNAAVRKRLLGFALSALIVGPLVFEQLDDVAKALRPGPRMPVLVDDEEIVAFLAARRSDGDELFLWEYRPGIFLETGMRSPSRFIDAHNLGEHDGAGETFGPEIFDALEAKPPRFLVDARFPPDDAQYAAFRALIDRDYVLRHTTTTSGTRIFERAVDRRP